MQPFTPSRERIVIVRGTFYPALSLTLEHDRSCWWGAFQWNLPHSGLWEPFRGPYPSREAAIRNVALSCRDMLRDPRLVKRCDLDHEKKLLRALIQWLDDFRFPTSIQLALPL